MRRTHGGDPILFHGGGGQGDHLGGTYSGALLRAPISAVAKVR
ncbi:hypothetical protein [Streptomyces globisporus]|nr:hypothetical protein [Streptomyces globisporus]